jgi:tetratricopeptide (TPR) repeat protein
MTHPRDAVQWALYCPPVLYFRSDEFAAGPDWQGMVRQSTQFFLRGDLQRAFDSNALALQTIIAIGQNDSDKALTVAQKTVEVAPDSATAWFALSYAQQARFDLEGARASLEKAVQLAPQNALAWARLAEIHSSFGRLKNALKAAQKAVDLEPNLGPDTGSAGIRLSDAGQDTKGLGCL